MADCPIRVLVVDDSASIRHLVCDLVDACPDLTVAGTANDGTDALEQVRKLRPDIVTLDLKMPRMDGLAALEAILDESPIPVIMVSASTRRDADETMRCLERGAVDYVTKPDHEGVSRATFGEELTAKLRRMAGADPQRILRIRTANARRRSGSGPGDPAGKPEEVSVPAGYRRSCVAIGISTGGPRALAQVFAELRPPLPPLVVVQHMPGQFTGPFAARLNANSAIEVKEAERGDVLRPNRALIAPGGKHLRIRKRGADVVAGLLVGETVSGHMPSVDVMMKDVANLYRHRCLGVIMTGMGSDGADGCAAIRRNGGYVLGQDEATSDVYGMNKVAFTQGHVDEQFSLETLPQLLKSQCEHQFRALTGTPPARASSS